MQQTNALSGYIRLHRSILQWEWHTDPNTLSVFIHCLALANFQDTKWHDIVIPRGSFVGSRASLAEKTGLSEKQVRTSIERLKRSGNLATKSTNKYTVYTVENYDQFQTDGQQEGRPEASKGPAKGQQRATAEKRQKRQEGKKEDSKESKRVSDPLQMVRELFPSCSDEFFDAWAAFLQMRKDTKSAVRSARAINALAKDLKNVCRSGSEAEMIAILDRSTAHNWKSFYELKTQQGQAKPGYRGHKVSEQPQLPGWYDEIPEEKASPEELQEALRLTENLKGNKQ